MKIEHNLQHSLWKLDPHMARALLEEELRELMETTELSRSSTRSSKTMLKWQGQIALLKKILGD